LDIVKLQFRVKDEVLGEDLSLDNLSLTILSEFTSQVATFVKGSSKVDLGEIKTSVKNGSVAIQLENSSGLLNDVLRDYELARTMGLVDEVDPRRIVIIEQWQTLAKRNESRAYELSLFDEVKKTFTNILNITKNSNFVLKLTNWVDVEEYVYGKVYDMGGKNKPNVHIELENGNTLKIDSEVSLLAKDNINRLYQKQLVRISAQKNIATKELRNEKLISFEHYDPTFDEESFNAIVKKGRLAWKSIASPSEWVESLRGNE